MTTPNAFRPARLLTIVALLAALSQGGCGQSGPTLYPISGEVKYKGQPVKGGFVEFEPDGEKVDPRGIQRADIKEGRYELPRNKGLLGGPYKVRINPTDGVPQEEMPYGKSLIPNAYVSKVDLPKEASTKDFDIPAQPGGK